MASPYKKGGGFDMHTNEGKRMQAEYQANVRRGCLGVLIIAIICAAAWDLYRWLTSGDLSLSNLWNILCW